MGGNGSIQGGRNGGALKPPTHFYDGGSRTRDDEQQAGSRAEASGRNG
jgi:hypothetical protein